MVGTTSPLPPRTSPSNLLAPAEHTRPAALWSRGSQGAASYGSALHLSSPAPSSLPWAGTLPMKHQHFSFGFVQFSRGCSLNSGQIGFLPGKPHGQRSLADYSP